MICRARPLLNCRKEIKLRFLFWPSQIPDLNFIEMQWQDIKGTVHARKLTSVAELKQFCREKWAEISPQWLNTNTTYQKRLVAVVAAKAGITSSECKMKENSCGFFRGEQNCASRCSIVTLHKILLVCLHQRVKKRWFNSW